MKKLQAPTCNPSVLFDECVKEILDISLRNRLIREKSLLQDANAKYSAASNSQTWCDLPRARRGNGQQLIVGTLTKDELVRLYTSAMVASSGAARKKYDEIKLLAHDECPYCGGCGELVSDEGIGTLDHFLPKAYFPVYSILPLNLVPACSTCNSGMGDTFPTAPEFQPLHPYFDAPHFFDEKWTTATVSEHEPVVVTFDVDPPAAWCRNDKQRVSQHFKACKLGGRYRVKVNSELSSLIDQRKTVHRTLSSDEFREILRTVADNNALPINGWKRSLYDGLAKSLWFCSNDFG